MALPGMGSVLKARRAPAAPARSLFDAIVAAGLTANLRVCLDAGTSLSWPGSGQLWLDLSGNGEHFYLGADGSAGADDPAFNGTVNGGSSGEYFSTDGGDFFRMASGIPAWVSAMHQNGAAFTILATVYTPTSSGASTRAIGNTANNLANPGIGFRPAEGTLQFFAFNGSGVAISKNGGTTPTLDAWNVSACSVNEAGTGFLWLNGAYSQVMGADTWAAAYSSPSASAANFALECLADGNGQALAGSGVRIAQLAIWSTTLTKANLDIILADAAVSTRFGL